MCYPFVSVIIPTYHDWDRLKLCLNALSKQTYPKNKFEIIIVNNDPTDLCTLIDIPSNYQLVSEKKKGSYAARNKGLTIAKGEVIAFTDSDCIPASDWLEQGVINLLNTENCGLVAGRINIFFKDANNPTPVEIYESITAFPQKNYIEEKHFGVTANLFTFISVFDKVGLFDEELQSGGDREWGQRVFKSNYRLIYKEEVCINHPARSSWQELYHKKLRTINGYQILKKKSNYYYLSLLFDLLNDIKPPLRLFIRVFKDNKLINPQHKLLFILVSFWVKYISFLIRIKTGLKTKIYIVKAKKNYI